MKDTPQEAIFDEAIRLAERAKERGLALKIMGAIAVRIHCPNSRQLFIDMERVLSDIDFAAYSKQRNDVIKYLAESGYMLDKRHAFVRSDRIILDNPKTKHHVDVFFDKLNMCHVVNFRGRLLSKALTIPMTELLLEKLQIVELTEKDIKDCIVLFREHEVGEGSDDVIDSARIGKILSDDWGFYYTATTNLKKIKERTSEYLTMHPADDATMVKDRIDTLLKRIEAKPKTFKWKMRALVGTRKKWYQEVDSWHGKMHT